MHWEDVERIIHAKHALHIGSAAAANVSYASSVSSSANRCVANGLGSRRPSAISCSNRGVVNVYVYVSPCCSIGDENVTGPDDTVTVSGAVSSFVHVTFVQQLPAEVLVTFADEVLPVVVLADLETTDAYGKRVLERMRSRLASNP